MGKSSNKRFKVLVWREAKYDGLAIENGREQRGKRPGLILASTKTDMILVVPLTSNKQALRFPNTVEIKRSQENGLDKDSIALIFQIQSLDKKRFTSKIGSVEKKYMSEIKNKIKELISL